MAPCVKMICDSCGSTVASQDGSGEAEALCEACRDRNEVQAAYDGQLMKLAKLLRSDPSAALAILDQLWSQYINRDRDGWLARSIRDYRALIFMLNNRHEEAMTELRTIEQCLREGSEEFADNKRSLANVLARSGKPREAIHEIELALAYRDHLHIGNLVGLLTTYAHIASEHGWIVPAKYQSTFERGVHEWGMPVSAELVGSDLTQAILLAASQRLAAQDRFVALLEELRGKPSDVRARLLREFIEAEPVGYFRDQAKRSLDGGEAPEGMEQEEG